MSCNAVLQMSSPPMNPGPGAVAEHMSLAGVPASVRAARAFVRETLGDLDGASRDTAVLLASELVTNAVLHARTPVELAVVVDRDQALVCVADHEGGSDAVRSSGHSTDRPGGRGLALVDGLSDRWGAEPNADGKTVWFTLKAAAPATRAG